MSQLEYSEYNNIVEVIDKSNAENAYQDLMGKEEKVLDTVNNVIKYYNDNEIKDTQFINQSFSYLVQHFFKTWSDIGTEIIESKNLLNDFIYIIKKENRIFYIGIMFIIISIFLYLVS
jgi:hypothetical protein